MIKSAIKSIIPHSILLAYHKALAILANLLYGFPSRKMVVIGVTGTKGKSSTVIMITRILEEAGHTVGSMNTVFFKVADKEWANTKKQGMLGRFQLQKMLAQMVRRKCDHAVVEVTSEGIVQHRQWGIAFDVVVFTNLSAEHIESHGSYERYREAKQIIFKQLHNTHKKVFGGQKVKKVIVVNADDKEAENFLKFQADEKRSVSDTGQALSLSLHGSFMRQNALLAKEVGRSIGVSEAVSSRALANIKSIPGRAEMLKTKSGATVFIDYAHEPKSFQAIHELGRHLAQNHNLISVFGATGGGRDTAKRPAMGTIAATHANSIILTTDDPYDDDPQDIINDIIPGITTSAKKWEQDKNVWAIVDRKKAIKHALSMAKQGDVVLILGKGSEQVMAVSGGKKIPWSDVHEVKAFTK